MYFSGIFFSSYISKILSQVFLKDFLKESPSVSRTRTQFGEQEYQQMLELLKGITLQSRDILREVNKSHMYHFYMYHLLRPNLVGS